MERERRSDVMKPGFELDPSRSVSVVVRICHRMPQNMPHCTLWIAAPSDFSAVKSGISEFRDLPSINITLDLDSKKNKEPSFVPK